ncbi:MAG TPA: histidine kinase N-terminal 7TM domain-containing protein [Fibrobacteria bacterium]|nr:histidine kinase N-terminal 7TM domain-containing protein [Fibrobacteria bacterium]
MDWNNIVFGILSLVSFGISAFIGNVCLHRKRIRGAKAYAFVSFSQAFWTFGLICEQISDSLAAKIFWDDVQFIGICGWGMAFVAFALAYAGRRAAHPRLLYGFLFLPALATVVLAFTDPYHGLMRSDIRLVPGASLSLFYDFTPALLAGAVLLFTVFSFYMGLIAVEMIRAYPPQRRQMAMVLAGNALPLAGILLTVTGMRESPDRDISPYTLSLGNILVAVGLFRYELFGIIPIALGRSIQEMGDAVAVLDRKKRVIHLNPAGLAELRFQHGNPIGRSMEELFPAWHKYLRENRDVMEADFEVEEGEGEGIRWSDVKIRPIRDDAGSLLGWVGTSRDATARKRMAREISLHRDKMENLVKERTAELASAYEKLVEQMAGRERIEERLRQARKMEAVGRLAGGIAHDFNNLLVPILGYSELAKRNAKPGTGLYMDLVQIEETAHRAAELVAQILAFSRHQVLELQILDLNEEVRKFVKLLGPLVGDKVKLETRLAPSLYSMKADRTQLNQVLMNLCINARDAMPNGGLLVLETANSVWSGEGEKRDGSAPLCVSLSVRDAGHGMDNDTLAHIFEPFFTTKKSGKGTGLGLATVYGIVEQHHGHIQVLSQPAVGTEFRVYFPATTASVRVAPFHPERPMFAQGMERILLVDEDEGVRRLARDALTMHGYTVLQAEGVDDALAAAAAAGRPIHLLITDMILPLMAGQDLFGKLKEVQPGIRVLYMSGYAERVAQGDVEHGAGVLRKPFSIRSLLDAVRLALGHLVPIPK